MISRQVSMPSLFGMITSMTMTWGSSLWTVLTASSPSSASPTTSKRPEASSTSRRPFLIIGWSSTTITLIRLADDISASSFIRLIVGPRR